MNADAYIPNVIRTLWATRAKIIEVLREGGNEKNVAFESGSVFCCKVI